MLRRVFGRRVRHATRVRRYLMATCPECRAQTIYVASVGWSSMFGPYERRACDTCGVSGIVYVGQGLEDDGAGGIAA